MGIYMEIKEIFNFNYKIIPEEYEDQLLDLIQSNDELNWNLVYQLLKGFADVDEWHIEWYFRNILTNYRRYSALHHEIKGSELRSRIEKYIKDKPYKK